jgi:hypothetical protein
MNRVRVMSVADSYMAKDYMLAEFFAMNEL